MNVSAVAQAPQNQQHPGMAGRGGNPGANGGPGGPRQQEQQAMPNAGPEPRELSPEELDATRSREIMTKAATGTILLLLKWFKVTREDDPLHWYGNLLTSGQMSSSSNTSRNSCWTITTSR